MEVGGGPRRVARAKPGRGAAAAAGPGAGSLGRRSPPPLPSQPPRPPLCSPLAPAVHARRDPKPWAPSHDLPLSSRTSPNTSQVSLRRAEKEKFGFGLDKHGERECCSGAGCGWRCVLCCAFLCCAAVVVGCSGVQCYGRWHATSQAELSCTRTGREAAAAQLAPTCPSRWVGQGAASPRQVPRNGRRRMCGGGYRSPYKNHLPSARRGRRHAHTAWPCFPPSSSVALIYLTRDSFLLSLLQLHPQTRTDMWCRACVPGRWPTARSGQAM